MTTIRTTCPTDGEVDMTPPDVKMSSDETSYAFVCPKCQELVEKRADRKIIALLKSAGVGFASELVEGPPVITEDDLLDFHDHIDDELQELLRG